MRKNSKDNPEELIKALQSAYENWAIHARGGRCNFGCGDGAMMNMERSNIISIREKLSSLNLPNYPDVYYQDVPNEVDRNLWINMELWAKAGEKLLSAYKSNIDYKYLLSIIDKLDSKQIKESCIETVIGYVSRFEYALNHWKEESGNDYDCRWYIRRHVSCPYYDAFERCVAKIKSFDIELDHKDSSPISFTVDKKGQLCFSF